MTDPLERSRRAMHDLADVMRAHGPLDSRQLGAMLRPLVSRHARG